MVQWLRLSTPNSGGPGLIPGQGTRFHMLQLRPKYISKKLKKKKKVKTGPERLVEGPKVTQQGQCWPPGATEQDGYTGPRGPAGSPGDSEPGWVTSCCVIWEKPPAGLQFPPL